MPKRYWIILLLAVATTCLLYQVDTDPPYPHIAETVMEGTINSIIIFGLFLTIDYVIQKIRGRQV